MVGGHVSNLAGYAGVALTLAQQALSVAVDAAPHRAREGEKRFAMARLLPAARVLLGERQGAGTGELQDAAAALGDCLDDPMGKVTDGFGHTRPIYGWLAAHLLGSAAKLAGDDPTLGEVKRAAHLLMHRAASSDHNDPRLGVWRRLVATQHGIQQAESLPLPSDEPAPLHPLGLNDLIDSWTYRELVGLHGLHLCALVDNDQHLHARAHVAALYHLGHTQPDYTTYQPWGLAAFASDPLTAVFAEQQLHDVATHLSLSGPSGKVLPALLLADAVATLNGRLAGLWA